MNVRRHSLIFGLSYALDVAGKNNRSHSKSTAYLAVMIGRELGLDEDAALNLYYAALLHDIGIGDEYSMKPHCVAGEAMLGKLPLPAEIPLYVLYHHEHDGSGPFGLPVGDIPTGAQIICLSSAFDDIFGETEKLDSKLFLEVSGWFAANKACFSAEVAGAFERLMHREYFLLDYFNRETKYALSEKIGVNDGLCYGFEDIKKYALCFADIIDQRSPFTRAHSTGIAALARKAAERLGYGGETQDKMYIAGLLHDVGKLNISTGILHKNGQLTPEEKFEINRHTYFTRKILEQIQGFEDIVDFAANHHERLDGTGYPYHMPAERLSELDRVMAVCDVYQALTEERPYRGKLPSDEVWRIIGGMAERSHLDGSLVGKLKPVFG